MPISLRPYQQELSDAIRAAFARYRRVLAVASTGAGKTVVFSYIAANAAAKQKRVIIVAHRIEIVKQISRALDNMGVRHGRIWPGNTRTADPVQVGMVQTVAKWLAEIPEPDLLVLDECFPAGTLVDERPIETIRLGDRVRTFDEVTKHVTTGYVTRIFSKTAKVVLRLIFQSGRTLVVTPNHPFFTTQGWIDAGNLADGCEIYIDSMCGVRGGRNLQHEGEVGRLETIRKNLLHDTLSGYVGKKGCFISNGADESCACFQAHDRTQPHGSSRDPRSDADDLARNRPSTKDEGRQRCPNGSGTTSSFNCVGTSLALGIRSSGWSRPHKRLADALQDRPRIPAIFGGGGSGWRQPLLAGQTPFGRSEGRLSKIDRVVGCEVFERGRSSEFDEVCPGGLVYNIEVEGTHTYFANGLAVHNCHHAVAGTWAKLQTAWQRARVLGVTATPQRSDGRGLGDAFDVMVEAIPMSELIALDHLAGYDYLAPPQQADLSAVGTRAGDYKIDELVAAMDKAVITGDAVSHYRDHLQGRPAIAFCVSIAHAEHVASQFSAAGYRAASVDGTMDPDIRARRIASIGDGRLQLLTSCDLISEGTDIPAVAGAILLRPTKSLAMFLQQIGRVLRPKPDRSRAVILDHVGNVHRHGLPDMPRVWTLEAKPKKPAAMKTATCKACFQVFAVAPGWVQAACDDEPGCLFGEREAAGRPPMDVVEGSLETITPERIAALRDRPLREVLTGRETRGELEEIAKVRGYAKGWAWHVVRERRRERGSVAA